MTEAVDHKALDAWVVPMDMAVRVYEMSAGFPESERYGLSAQMRRAAVSIPSNVAEGVARGVGRGCIHQLTIALGSVAELETQLEVALRLKYVTETSVGETQKLVTSSRRLILGLRRAKTLRLAASAGGSIGMIILCAFELFAR